MKKGFTLLEMIFVLLVISVVVLLTVPNIASKKKIINDVGCQALLEVVNAQMLVAELKGDYYENIDDLVTAGYLTSKQTVCPSGQEIIISNGQAKLK